MEFYFGKGSIAFASLIALEEVDANYQLIKIDTKAWEQRKPEYLAKNPKGRVPLLITDEGPISETPAILSYLAARFPEAGLVPQDQYRAARVQEALSYFASTFHVAHAMKLRGYRWTDKPEVEEELRLKVAQNMGDCAQYVEDHLFEGPYLWGDYSIADMHLYALSNWFEADGVNIADYPKLAEWRALMDARAAVKAAWIKSDG